MPWTPVRLCKAGMPPVSCCMLPFSCVPVVCAHVVSCVFPVPSTLPFPRAALFFACQSLARMLLAVFSGALLRCGYPAFPLLHEIWFSAFVACDVVMLPFLCCMQKSPLGGARGSVPGPSLPPAAWSFGPQRRASGKYLTRHLTPLPTCQHACMIHDPCLDCSRP